MKQKLGVLIALLAVGSSLFIARTTLAADPDLFCWCRDAAFICTRDQSDGIIPGAGLTPVNITGDVCNAFCAGRSSGSHSIHLDATDQSLAICPRDCIAGGSCMTPPNVGMPALNTCIVRNLSLLQNVESLTECCEANQVGDETPATVGYSGTVQNCPTGLGPIPSSVPSTTVIRLFNPLGSDVDIPGFIGRGIRGVLGVIGAIALLMFVYGGVTWMTAGDSERVGNAKNIIKNSVIGLLLIFFSYNLIGIFFDFFT